MRNSNILFLLIINSMNANTHGVLGFWGFGVLAFLVKASVEIDSARHR